MCDMFTWLAILCYHLVCGDRETKSLCKSYADKKENYKRKRLGQRMINIKSIWKPGFGKIAKASRGIAPGSHKGGLQRPIWKISCKGQRADVRWVMAHEHKTQSFMKNGDQQKYLDKALLELATGQSNSW